MFVKELEWVGISSMHTVALDLVCIDKSTVVL